MATKTRRRANSTVDSETHMAWRAQHGRNKVGDEDTDEYSDCEGDEDEYQDELLRKKITLLINDKKRVLHVHIGNYLQTHFPNVSIAEGQTGSDGKVQFEISGVDDIGKFIETISNANLEVHAVAGSAYKASRNGSISRNYSCQLIYDPEALIVEYLEGRNYLYKRIFNIVLFFVGLFIVWHSWQQIAVYVKIANVLPVAIIFVSVAMWWSGYGSVISWLLSGTTLGLALYLGLNGAFVSMASLAEYQGVLSALMLMLVLAAGAMAAKLFCVTGIEEPSSSPIAPHPAL